MTVVSFVVVFTQKEYVLRAVVQSSDFMAEQRPQARKPNMRKIWPIQSITLTAQSSAMNQGRAPAVELRDVAHMVVVYLEKSMVAEVMITQNWKRQEKRVQ